MKFKREIVALSFMFYTCIGLTQTYTWTQKADFGGGNRFAPSYFSIGDKGYAGSGLTFTGSTYNYIWTDFWEYDQPTCTWTQKANIPGSCRSAAAGFALNGKGYVTTGWTPSQTNSTFQYDPASNVWTPKANFGGTARYSTAYFTIASCAYVGMGYAPFKSDFWRYDPVADTWTQVASIGGTPRSAPNAFAIGSRGYVFGGVMSSGLATNELWEYNPAANSWSQKASMPGAARYAPATFVMDGLGFVGLGANVATIYNDFFAYNPATNSWTSVPSLPSAARYGGFSFSLNNRGYVGAGAAGIVPTTQLRTDFWELGPANPLPVTLTSFNATVTIQNQVVLKWTTESELNNDYFNLEKSSDGQSFEPLAQINGAGSSNSLLEYAFTDQHPLIGCNYYKLKQTDFNGKTIEYKTVIVKLKNSNSQYSSLKVVPNPFTNNFTAGFYSPGSGPAQIQIINLAGDILFRNDLLLSEGFNSAEVTSVSNLKQGCYLICIVSNGSFIASSAAFHN